MARRKGGFTRCVYACRSPFGNWRAGPCEECQKRYDELMDEAYAEYQAEKEHRAFLAIKPATDEEWLRRLDEVSPLVTDFTSLQFKELSHATI